MSRWTATSGASASAGTRRWAACRWKGRSRRAAEITLTLRGDWRRRGRRQPDLSIADDAFQVHRALHLVNSLGAHYRERRHLLRTLRSGISAGSQNTGEQVAAAQAAQSKCFERMQKFLTRYDFICPVNQVLPFDVTTPYPTEIDGVQLGNYLDWMKSACRITMTSHPLPVRQVAFADNGLPVGMQIVGHFWSRAGSVAARTCGATASGRADAAPVSGGTPACYAAVVGNVLL